MDNPKTQIQLRQVEILPSVDTPEALIEAWSDLVADGELPGKACKKLGISYKALVRLANEGGRGESFLRARELLADVMVERAYIAAANAIDSEEARRLGPMIDLTKWWVARLAPRAYGDKQAIEHTHRIQTVPVINLDSAPRLTE